MSFDLHIHAGTEPRERTAAAVDPIVGRAIETAREFLDMEMGYVADTRGGLQEYLAVAGDGESFGARAGRAIPLEGTYCAAMLDGELPNAIPDARADERVSGLPITAEGGIGAYVGVPIVLSDGEVFGTFCCLSHSAVGIEGRQVELMRMLARLVADQVEREQAEAERRSLAMRAGNVAALVAAIEARDGYTGEHSRAVVELALAIGRELGLHASELADLENVALLHDVGKIGIADAVLRKPGSLTPAEWEEVRRHPEIGARIVASMPGLAHLAPAIRAEHERWDGGGYPDGLSGTRIPLLSRIVLVADAYHAITSDRPYRRAAGHDAALAELRCGAGGQFCPRTVGAALAVLAAGDRPVAEAAGEPLWDPAPGGPLPAAPALADLARELSGLAAAHDERADAKDRAGKPASAAISRRRAAEYRERLRQARSDMRAQRALA